jgi:hypothetical protein
LKKVYGYARVHVGEKVNVLEKEVLNIFQFKKKKPKKLSREKWKKKLFFFCINSPEPKLFEACSPPPPFLFSIQFFFLFLISLWRFFTSSFLSTAVCGF